MPEINLPPTVQPFWDAFQETVPFDATARFYEVFFFADTERMANELAELVLAGVKRATAGLLWIYEAEQKPLPKPGDLSIVTNWSGQPQCVIETEQVNTVPFDEVSEAFARMEGEGDKSLRWWREAHWDYFSRECAQIGKEPRLNMPVVCEQFKVVYRP